MPKKKKEGFYGRFLSVSIVTANPIAIAIIIAITPATMYIIRSVVDARLD
jgi:hypothetical protein